MFRDVKLKLTLVNTVMLLVFLLVLVTIVYSYMNRVLTREVDQRLSFAASRVRTLDSIPLIRMDHPELNNIVDRPPDERFKDQLKLVYILRDSNLQVTAASPGSEAMEEASREQAGDVIDEKLGKAITIEVNGEKVRVFSALFNRNGLQGVIQVFQGVELERNFLAHLMTLLVILGLAGITPAVAAGWYLAGKGLIPIKKSWQQQRDFVSDASHELRTPLAVVQTNLEVALSNPESKVAENVLWLDNALTETKRMGKLINDLLLLAEADSHQVVMETKLFNISAAAEETAGKMKTIFESARLDFSPKIEPALIIDGDEERIKQLLVILLDNAIKYTPEGGRISLGISAKHGKVEINVSDTGMGIDESEKERIFQRFYRVDKARSRAQGGTGLGLAIADWIVKNHQGKIKVESQPGKGSSFLVELPAGE